jgi:nitric oxide reductase NorD protein
MLDFLELEETVGRAWHRLVGGAVSYPRYPEHRVSLDEVKAPLAVFFRGLGGEFGVQLAGMSARSSLHRLSLRQRIGIAEERLEQPGRDAATLFLSAAEDRAVSVAPVERDALFVACRLFCVCSS